LIDSKKIIRENYFENFRDSKKLRCRSPKHNFDETYIDLMFDFFLLEDGIKKITCRSDRLSFCSINLDRPFSMKIFNFNNLYAGAKIQILLRNYNLKLKKFQVFNYFLYFYQFI